ncbi:MAG: poly-gamma-glutamate biosynthesis protein PgsC/CapC [Methylococcales bacterium]|nr:poly-gamma-glutamate biosynthesis protein PgsC/CapC [Methylococcales bacterium]
MDIFPLHIFPQGSLSSSVITTVWVGMFVVCFFNLRLGWVLSGLVVPGYLVPLLLIKPWAASVVLLEGFITYFIVWFLSEYLSRYAAWSNLFGRDRFFALVLCSIVIRLFFDGYLLPEIGQWLNAYWDINFDYHNQLHSFGLIIIALIANQFWKTGFVRGLVPLIVTLGSTLLIVRYGLMEFTNFSLSNIGYLYEGVATSIVSSPKAYIILICTAFLASRMNLLYGWDFNGILIPSLLALQWYEPIKIAATVVESTVILVMAMLLLKAPILNKMTIEGGPKLLLFFNVSFAYKIALGYALLAWFPEVKITDFYGFGYLLATLIAIKIHDKAIFSRLLGATLSTSFASVLIAGIVGFSLTLLPISKLFQDSDIILNEAVAAEPLSVSSQDLNSLLEQARLSFYQTKVQNSFIKPTMEEIELFSDALKLIKAHLKVADADKLQQARLYLQ